MMRRLLPLIVIVLLGTFEVGAQEVDEDALFGAAGRHAPGDNEDELFGGGGLIADLEDSEADASTVFLRSERVEIGGTFRFDASSTWRWDGAEGPFGASLLDDPLTLDLGVVTFLDARPAEDFRVFARLDVSYPFTEEGGIRTFDQVFHMRELFSDFQFADALFLRAGKQTINWGVGYFFSPADLLNVTSVDPEDPEAELEGPVALKIQAPMGPHNLYLYTVFEDADSVVDLALAPKAELVVRGTEVGLGAFYRAGNAPAAMATLSTTLADLRLFAEGLLSYGSDRTFVVEDVAALLGVATEIDDSTVFPSATAGLSYRYTDDLELFNLSITAQYLYNGQGYADPDLLKDHAAGVAALVLAGDVSAGDLADRGRHYAAARASWTGLLGSDLDLSFLWIANLSDGSGMVVPALKWQVSDELDFTVKTGFAYGGKGDELSPIGDAATLTLSANFGGGRF